MKNILYSLFMGGIFLCFAMTAIGQDSPNCATVSVDNQLTGSALFNYGSATNSFNQDYRVSVTIGLPVVGTSINEESFHGFGYWTRFLLSPQAPLVRASEGELVDRIEINWALDPLSPVATNGYKIYRDGNLLATVDGNTDSYIDFNVIAGIFYTYEVSGINTFGQGPRNSTLGFLNPNGVVTGQVKSFGGNPVFGAIVTLSPSLGSSIRLNGTDDMAFAEFDTLFSSEQFTVSAWVKFDGSNDDKGILDFGSSQNKNWWLHTMESGAGTGVTFGMGDGAGSTDLSYAFPVGTEEDWHFIAATYNGSSLILYGDGELISSEVATIVSDSIPMFFGKKDTESGFFKGNIDDVRIYDRQLSQTELQMFKNRTVPADAEGLVSYWKFDEGIGNKSFDQSQLKSTVYFCGAQFTSDRADIVNAGLTDETGFYKIAGVNYGGGNTFTVRPDKSFYYNQSLEYNGQNGSYTSLTDVQLGDTSAISITFKAFDFSASKKVLLDHDINGSENFQLSITGNNLSASIDGNPETIIGTIGTDFNQVILLLAKTGSGTDVSLYNNGVFQQQINVSGQPTELITDNVWTVGGNLSSGSYGDYFTGLIDEVAIYDQHIDTSTIETSAAVGTDPVQANLQAYFNFNEGSGEEISDMGLGRSGYGQTVNTLWSTVAKIEETFPHEFLPSSRLVTLDPSNTSVDQVDFTDLSSIPVSGYARYEGTNCFIPGVEILVNGQSHTPQILTDADGKWSGDFEPGSTILLSAIYEEHMFSQPWELRNLSAPVAGILFLDLTKRTVRGRISGGLCERSIIPALSTATVNISTLDGCYSKDIILDGNGFAHNGKFVFSNVPPDSVMVSITGGTGVFASLVTSYFMFQGGEIVDLIAQDDSTSFTFYVTPEVEISLLPTNICGDPLVEGLEDYSVDVRVFEQYTGGVCYLDTALLTINNNIADLAQYDTLMTDGTFELSFVGGGPNLIPPYMKNIQITATPTSGKLGSAQVEAVVLGKEATQTSFASTAPETPVIILRDPPGDGSFSYLEQDQKTCFEESFEVSTGVDLSQSVTASLGADLTTVAGLGFAVEFEIESTNDYSISTEYKYNHLESNTMETCLTVSELISTGDNDLVVGSEMGGDVFIGAAKNYIFGGMNELVLDTTGGVCSFEIEKGITIRPDGFETTFIYTEDHIRDVVIPTLDSSFTSVDSVSADRWREMLAFNDSLKNVAVFSENISFGGGVYYEKSETSEVSESTSNAWTVELDAGIAIELGIEINGIGIATEFVVSRTNSEVSDQTQTNTSSRKVGYTLTDDDVGDLFTVDVKQDRVYGTPVFDLLGGRSQCPHEGNTLFREKLSMSIDKNVAINVPSNDVAEFILSLNNNSETDELKVYDLRIFQENNPLGAEILISGGEDDVSLEIPAGESKQLTLTVGRGPTAFTYLDLNVSLVSDCEYDRAIILNDAVAEEFIEEIRFDVYFLEPCSPVDITNPMQGWVQDVPAGINRNITLADYDIADTELELIRVQYRREQGNGAWINLDEILKADLMPVATNVNWSTNGLADGLYEIRAVTQCSSGLNPGISTVIKGKIERTPPEIFGVPEPGDGVLSQGDEISITFNEPIRCDLIIQADVQGNNNIGLYDTQNGSLIDANITCSNDKIVIDPNVPQEFIENKVLRVEVDMIFDLVGNSFLHADWEFFADQNPMRWQASSFTESKFEDEHTEYTREIANTGGASLSYTIDDIPDWVEIFPREGILAPGEQQLINFIVDSNLVVGAFLDTIFLNGPLGNEPLPLDMRVLCRPPSWSINPADYSSSMNLTVNLDIEGTLSADREDIVAAFINDELRGLAYVEYQADVDDHLAFLTVYNNEETGDTIDFQIWDASDCLLYGQTIERFAYVANGQEGSPLLPTTLHTQSLLLSEIDIVAGWNWLSFNLEFPDPSINEGLSSLAHPQNDLIKNQTQFAEYLSSPTDVWVGSLTTLDNTSMFQYKGDSIDILRLIGQSIDPTTITIPIVNGWNWIGYLPQQAKPTNIALASLSPINGDLIKSQTEFAQYVSGIGWVGNLEFMSAPNGYQIYLANGGTLSYPANSFVGPQIPQGKLLSKTRNATWEINPAEYEHTMTLVASISTDGINTTEDSHVLAAFVDGEVRGVSEVLYVQELDDKMFFMTIYANKEDEQVQFKLSDTSTDETSNLNEEMLFGINSQEGNAVAPFPFTIDETTSIGNIDVNAMTIHPNPFSNRVTIDLPIGYQMVELTITNMQGQAVLSDVKLNEKEHSSFVWEATGVPAGIYNVNLKTTQGDHKERVIKIGN
ncbi:MAG: hypothetical protein ACI86M_002080 [Saprospiraceae bacterium]|jgi:hypothetical protein